jgi:hypothetical protein
MRDEEALEWRAHAHVDKWDAEQVAWALRTTGASRLSGDELMTLVEPSETADSAGNLLLTAGLNRLTSLLIGGGGQAITNTSARLGVGDSVTAEAVGQTDLQAAAGSTHRWFQVMDATYPSQADGVVTLKSTFGTTDGNFVWAEWGIDVAAPVVASGNTVAALLFNRKVYALGTKAAGSIWTLTATVTIS